MARIASRILNAAGACLLVIALLTAPAAADDAARIAYLESEIQKLRTQINEQDRRIQRLEAELQRRDAAAAPARITLPAETMAAAPASGPRPWHSGAAWDRIAQGMTQEQVTEILGAPTAVESVDVYKTLFYRGATVAGRAIGGHVNLRDGRVVAIRKPNSGS